MDARHSYAFLVSRVYSPDREVIRCTKEKLLKWSTMMLAPQMQPPINLKEVLGNKPAWEDTSLSVEVTELVLLF